MRQSLVAITGRKQVTLRLRLVAVACLVKSWYNSTKKPGLGIRRKAQWEIVVRQGKCKSDMLTCCKLLHTPGRVPVMLLLLSSSWLSCSTATCTKL